ncbi:hypothetical protein L0668_13740 [Paraglaciecola aquimarina]|uniref:Tetratricopeptide repeat protein n=1 Tax=Paraglaciecola algarum TaxID=3050085 RepID=A0ABS9DAX4_9ALTE|nr:hypothetical protein [Paraglaciecola sp. G1-23]MCF2949177.1 hypothetical protein [Paraglaciecola sp. G1-23]
MKSFKIRLLFTARVGIAFCTLLVLGLVATNTALAHGNHVHKPREMMKKSDYSNLDLSALEQKIISMQYLMPREESIKGLLTRLENIPTQSNVEKVKQLYLYARVQQHNHDFDKAKQNLSKALDLSSKDINSLLLMASVSNNLGEHEAALRYCKQLLGLADGTIIAACIVETKVQINPEQLQTQYQNLQRVAKLSGASNNQYQFWVNEILAELALKMDKPQIAKGHLNDSILEQAPVSYIALWSDIEIALNNHSHVLDTLSNLTADQNEINDALLLRLSMAEKAANSKTTWLHAMRRRITERSNEHNYAHAAELAKFYLYVDHNPSEAKHWAKVNSNHAKSHMDVDLLAAANSMEN